MGSCSWSLALILSVYAPVTATAVLQVRSTSTTNTKVNRTYSSGIVNGAAAGGFFRPDALLAVSDGELNLGCLRVGPKGKSVRKYAKCCGTQVGVVEKAFIALGLNSLYTNKECTDKYIPREPVVNVMKKYAFDPEKVPEPSHSVAPLLGILKFLAVLINPFGPSTKQEILDKFAVNHTEAEEVPITWE